MTGHAPTLTFIWDDGLDSGELIVALLFATSAVIAISMIVAVLSDKLSQARVSSAARLAAENAAREPSPDLAMRAAQEAAADTLTDLQRFGRPMIVVDVSRFQTAGLVEVTVACTVAPRDRTDRSGGAAPPGHRLGIDPARPGAALTAAGASTARRLTSTPN